MITYKIKGLHCGNCSTELETRINASQHDAAVSIDYDHRELTVDESKADLKAIFKILEFNKTDIN
ncbi:MAG: heavy-metal-associated domain-containing protein [Alkalibacterium thalassium]|nr:heavy-metal-associated domain-containing protein [Alkalibacterium thalassium]